MNPFVTFGASRLDAILSVLADFEPSSLEVLPRHPETFVYQPTTLAMAELVEALASGELDSLKFKCSGASATIYAQRAFSSVLEQYACTVACLKPIAFELYRRCKTTADIDFVALTIEEAPDFDLAVVSADTFPWEPWDDFRRIKAAARRADRTWEERVGPVTEVSRVFITGPGLAGTQEIARAIGRIASPAAFAADQATYGDDGGWTFRIGAHSICMRMKLRTSRFYDPADESSWSNPLVRDEAAFIRSVDVIVFVVDSQPTRMAANLEALARLERTLTRLGRNARTIPIVFAMNKRDLPGVASTSVLSRALSWPRRAHAATVATTGAGVTQILAAIEQLLDTEDFPSETLAGRIVDALVTAHLVDEGDNRAALEIAAEEIEIRSAVGDY